MTVAKRGQAARKGNRVDAMPLVLSDQMMSLIAQRFRMLGEPMRLRILQVLESGEQTVRQIVETLQGNQSNLSRHLLALRAAGILARRQAGNSVFYSIADPVILEVCRIACEGVATTAGGQAARSDKQAEMTGRKTKTINR